MSVTASLAIVVLVAVSLAAPFVLYALIRAEGETEKMDREEAERAARRDVEDRH